MAEAIVIRDYGAAEVLKLEEIGVGAPGPGELRIRQTAVGVNFHDVYVRSGLYKTLALPGTPGCEATGVVEAVGAGVTGIAPGDRIVYVTASYGAYASARLLPASLALKLPDDLDDTTTAATMLRAMTVEMLAEQVHPLRAGMTILVQAAAGGVGRMLCQWAAQKGVTVIGTVGSEEKAAVARAAGCSHTILYRETDFVQAVAEITDGRGVEVAYDSVGADTFLGSLDALALCGHLVNFGQSSGPVDPLLMTQLAAKSASVSRPILFHYIVDTARYQEMAQSVFAAFKAGVLKADGHMPFPLAEAARAHETLEGRSGGGSLVLIP